MIQQCFNSVQSQMKDDYTIIILDKDNIKDYLDFPPFVIEKLENNFFGEKTITFFFRSFKSMLACNLWRYMV